MAQDRIKKSLARQRRVLSQLRTLKSQHQALSAKYTKEQTRWEQDHVKVEQYEAFSREKARKNLDLQYLEVSGNYPILWITTVDPTLVKSGTFANIMDRIKRIAPDIELVVMTHGDIRLYEMTDAELNRIGLARITGHDGGIDLSLPKPRIETDTDG